MCGYVIQCDVMVHLLFWLFSNEEMIRKEKIEVTQTLFCVFAGTFYQLCRAIFLKFKLSFFSNLNSALRL